MALFHFDIFDGMRLWIDAEGTEHADLNDARREAIETLSSMGRETFTADPSAKTLWVEIREGDGPALERIALALNIEALS